MGAFLNVLHVVMMVSLKKDGHDVVGGSSVGVY